MIFNYVNLVDSFLTIYLNANLRLSVDMTEFKKMSLKIYFLEDMYVCLILQRSNFHKKSNV